MQNGTDTAPVLPWDLRVTNSVVHYEHDAEGTTLIFTPAATLPNGMTTLLPPQVRVRFDRDGWERFRREVAADGQRAQVLVPKLG